MKILVVINSFLPIVGGAEIGCHKIFNRIGTKHEIHILTPKRGRRHLEKLATSDSFFNQVSYKVFHFKDSLKTPKRMYSWLWGLFPPFSLSFIISVLKHIKKFKPDLINFQGVFPGGLALIFTSVVKKIPIVLTLFGRWDVFGKEIPFFWRFFYFRLVVKFSTYVVSISKYCLGNLNVKKFKIIPYGVDTKRFTPGIDGRRIRKKLGISNDKTVLLALQRLSSEKRVDILIKAMEYIVSKMDDVVLLIGGKGPEEKKLKLLTKNLNIQDKVIFTGYIPESELPQYFASCDIFIFHSTFETFGVIFPQAFASGKPVVTVNSTAIPEVVEDRITGMLVEPLNPKKFALKVIEIVKNKEMCWRFAQNARGKALKEYNWDIIAHIYEDVFTSVTPRR